MSQQLTTLLKSARVIICVGSGGVGKTTTASAMAYLAANLGRRVLVLTIDPSQRLKTTMGLEAGSQRAKIEIEGQGELYAELIDNKRTFDEFVRRGGRGSATVEKVLQNKLYRELSTSLAGSQDFTALERLYSAHESKEFDLVILDTPPTEHAIDFLEAPKKLNALFKDPIMRWFRDPEGKEQGFFRRLISVGTQQAIRGLEMMTGSEFLHELKDFFIAIYSWQDNLDQRITQAQELLRSRDTHFLLVTSLDESKLKEARYFASEISRLGSQVTALIINRYLPEWMSHLSPVRESQEPLSALEVEVRTYFEQKLSLSNDIERSGFVVKVPEFKENISDLESVKKLAKFLEKG